MGGVLCIMMSFGFRPDFEGIAATAGFAHPNSNYNVISDPEQGAPAVPHGLADNPETSHLNNVFPQAVATWKQNKEKLPGKTCRELWAFHQQATVGDCNKPKPDGTFNGNAKEQWRLWNKLQGISQDDAKLMFIERLKKADLLE